MKVCAAASSSSAAFHGVNGGESLDSILTRLSMRKTHEILENVPPLLKEAYPKLTIEKLLGEGAFSEAHSFTYLEEGQIKRRVIKFSHETAIRRAKRFYKLNEERMGGEWLALLDYCSPNVLKTYQAIAIDHNSGRYILVDAAEVQRMFDDPRERKGKGYKLIGTVSEYVKGAKTLKERMPIGGIREVQAIHSLAKQLLSAVSAIHAKGIMHRDIKPPNILVTPDGTLKLFDFGFSCYLPLDPPLIGRFFCPGSLATVAPEVLVRKRKKSDYSYYDHKVDCYSVAATIVWAAKGSEYYFYTRNFAEIWKIVASGTKTLSSVAKGERLDADIQGVVANLSIRDPEERHTAYRVLKRYLDPGKMEKKPNTLSFESAKPPSNSGCMIQ